MGILASGNENWQVSSWTWEFLKCKDIRIGLTKCHNIVLSSLYLVPGQDSMHPNKPLRYFHQHKILILLLNAFCIYWYVLTSPSWTSFDILEKPNIFFIVLRHWTDYLMQPTTNMGLFPCWSCRPNCGLRSHLSDC